MSSPINNFFLKLFGKRSDFESEGVTNHPEKHKYFKRQSTDLRIAMLDLNKSELGFRSFGKDRTIQKGEFIIEMKEDV